MQNSFKEESKPSIEQNKEKHLKERDNEHFSELEQKNNIEIAEELYKEKKEKLEDKELLTEEEKAIKEKLQEEMVKIKLNSSLTDDVKKKVIQIKPLNKKEKLDYLLNITEEKGVIFAIVLAKKMNDPYILDTFHDILVREGLYKNFKM